MTPYGRRVTDLGEYDPYRDFIGMVPSMVDRSRAAIKQGKAYSYRSFLVAATGFFFDDEAHSAGVLSAGNTKKQDRPKVCAEQKLLKIAKKADLGRLLGLVVVGTSDRSAIEEVTFVPTPTLHPCGECREVFRSNVRVNDDTLIVTTTLNHDRYEAYRFGQLYELYDNDETARLQSGNVRQGFDDWNRRVDNYNHLVAAEASVDRDSARTGAELAQRAMLADFPILS